MGSWEELPGRELRVARRRIFVHPILGFPDEGPSGGDCPARRCEPKWFDFHVLGFLGEF